MATFDRRLVTDMANPKSLVYALHNHWDTIEALAPLSRELPAFEQDQVLAVIMRMHPGLTGNGYEE